MPLTTVAEITSAVDRKERSMSRLIKRFDDDFELWKLTAYSAEKGFQSYTSNKPRTLAERISDSVAYAPALIRIPLAADTDEARDRKNMGERFIYGNLNLINSRLEAMVEPTIQEQLAWLSTIRGWYAIRVFYNQKGGKAFPQVAIWDVSNTTWEVGADGLLWACHKRTLTPDQAKAEWDYDAGANTVLYDFWDETKNSVIIGGDFVKSPKKHKLDHVPVFICAVGLVPTIQSKKDRNTILQRGESVFAPNRELYESDNQVMSYFLTVTERGIRVPLASYTEDGRDPFTSSPYEGGTTIPLRKGEKVEPAFTPTMPREAAQMAGMVGKEISMGGIPPIAYGEIEFQMPGYGISLLHHAASAKIQPTKMATQKGEAWLGRELLNQFGKLSFEGKVELHGRDGSGEYFECEIAPEDVRGDWFPECEIIPKLPEDESKRYIDARTAVEAGLLSKETARDRILRIQDTEVEEQKVMREQAMAMPPIMLRRMAASFVAAGNMEMAQIFLDEISRTETMAKAKATGNKEEAVQQEFAGMDNRVFPPEEAGKIQKPPGGE